MLFLYVHKNIGMGYSLDCEYSSFQSLFVKGWIHSLWSNWEVEEPLGSRDTERKVAHYRYDLEWDLEICLSVFLCLSVSLFLSPSLLCFRDAMR